MQREEEREKERARDDTGRGERGIEADVGCIAHTYRSVYCDDVLHTQAYEQIRPVAVRLSMEVEMKVNVDGDRKLDVK